MELLKKLRQQRGLYQKDVASFLGVDRTTYVKYETGASEPDNKTLSKLADFYDVSVDELLGRDTKSEQKENPSGKSEGIDETNIEILNVWSTLSLEQKEKALSYLHFLKQEDKENP